MPPSSLWGSYFRYPYYFLRYPYYSFNFDHMTIEEMLQYDIQSQPSSGPLISRAALDTYLLSIMKRKRLTKRGFKYK